MVNTVIKNEKNNVPEYNINRRNNSSNNNESNNNNNNDNNSSSNNRSNKNNLIRCEISFNYALL
ncbi:hypothetical protein PMALA_069410, partial [Plasmodium malariae]